ncbi:MAG: hypothetical protein ABL888_06700 [Pirellulaceae bacterium]
MEIEGIVQDGVVVLPAGVSLVDGTVVVVRCPESDAPSNLRPRKRVQLPLVSPRNPDSIHLTNDMIAEFLNDTEIPR